VEPPYVPEISSNDDTSHFDDSGIEDTPDVLGASEPKRTMPFSGNHLPFVGFSFSRHLPFPANGEGGGDANTSRRISDLEKEIERLKAERAGLQKTLSDHGLSTSPMGQVETGDVTELLIAKESLQSDKERFII